MININDLEFQKLDYNGLQTLIKYAREEGWNPGFHDADVYWQTDENGFYGFFHNDELIAGGAIVSYNGEFGFMGLFIVKPEHRGSGIGRKLWFKRRDTLLSRLNENAAIGMDGVVAMQPFYQKGGFEIAFKDERYERVGEAFEIDTNISPIEADDLEEVLAYDKVGFGFSRPQFLKPWLNIPKSKKFKYTENGKVQGFVMIRPIPLGWKVGPLFAENAMIAEALYQACLNAVIGESLLIDIPMINTAAVEMIKKYDAKYVFECARMYYRSPPKVDFNKVFGITTFELG